MTTAGWGYDQIPRIQLDTGLSKRQSEEVLKIAQLETYKDTISNCGADAFKRLESPAAGNKPVGSMRDAIMEVIKTHGETPLSEVSQDFIVNLSEPRTELADEYSGELLKQRPTSIQPELKPPVNEYPSCIPGTAEVVDPAVDSVDLRSPEN